MRHKAGHHETVKLLVEGRRGDKAGLQFGAGGGRAGSFFVGWAVAWRWLGGGLAVFGFGFGFGCWCFVCVFFGAWGEFVGGFHGHKAYSGFAGFGLDHPSTKMGWLLSGGEGRGPKAVFGKGELCCPGWSGLPLTVVTQTVVGLPVEAPDPPLDTPEGCVGDTLLEMRHSFGIAIVSFLVRGGSRRYEEDWNKAGW